MSPKSTLFLCGAILISASGGTFGGLWLWDQYKAWGMASAQRAAEAFKTTPIGQQREAVKRFLNDPESAEFRNEKLSKRENVFCGEVNAKNRMGAMVGFTRYIAEIDGALPDLQRVDLDVTNAYSDHEKTVAANFQSRWSIYCY